MADSGARHMPCPPLKSNWRQHQHHLSRGLFFSSSSFSLFLLLRHLERMREREKKDFLFITGASVCWSYHRCETFRSLLVCGYAVPPCHLPPRHCWLLFPLYKQLSFQRDFEREKKLCRLGVHCILSPRCLNNDSISTGWPTQLV